MRDTRTAPPDEEEYRFGDAPKEEETVQIKAYAVDMETFELLAKESKWVEGGWETAAHTAERLIAERNVYRAALYQANRGECLRVEKLLRGERGE
jgi:hypothetical protein